MERYKKHQRKVILYINYDKKPHDSIPKQRNNENFLTVYYCKLKDFTQESLIQIKNNQEQCAVRSQQQVPAGEQFYIVDSLYLQTTVGTNPLQAMESALQSSIGTNSIISSFYSDLDLSEQCMEICLAEIYIRDQWNQLEKSLD